MKYEKEIDGFFKELLYEDWMSEEDYNNIVDTTLLLMGKTKEDLSNDIEIGVKNGYSIELQMDLMKEILKLDQ